MAKKLITISLVLALGFATAFLTGCESDAQTGALIGTGLGALAGQAIGGDTEGTLIGAAGGAGVGYMLGNEGDKKKATQDRASIREEMMYQTVNVTNSNGSIIQVRVRKDGVGYRGPRGEYYSTLPTEGQLRPVYGF